MEIFRLHLNGKEVPAYPGMTLLELSRGQGIEIPTLCAHPALKPEAACRLCVVEDRSRGALVTACDTPAVHGMDIHTDSSTVTAVRKTIVSFLMSDHAAECSACVGAPACRLRRIAAEVGVDRSVFGIPASILPVDAGNPFIERDLNLCVKCGLCVRACREIQGLDAIGYADAGLAPRDAAPRAAPLRETECSYCGACLMVCPTGALRQADIPPPNESDRRVDTVCSFCACGCAMEIRADDNHVIQTLPTQTGVSVNGISLCARGFFGHDFINSPNRLADPLIRKDNRLVETGWDEALDFITVQLAEIKKNHGPDALGVYGSIRCTNEENYLIQKFSRATLGTNNTCNSARMTSFATIMGLGKAFGYGCATGALDDIECSDVIFVIGANPHDSHPVIAQKIRRAVRSGKTTLIQADPRETELSRFAALRLRPRPGTDLALINGIMHVIMDENLFDKSFVESRTDGVDRLSDCVMRYPPRYTEKITGVPEPDVLEAARLFARAGAACVIYGAGVTQYVNAAYTALSIANLALLTGNVGRRGAGVYPLIQENNGQGACDMGALPDYLPGYQKINDAAARAVFEKEWNAPLPENEGRSGVEMVADAAEGRIKGLVLMGANPVEAFPDSKLIRRAFESLNFLAVLDIFPTPTAQLAHVVLPCTCFAEKDGTYTSCERRIQRVRKAVDPPGRARPDWWILSELMRRMGTPAPYDSPSDIMDEIARTVPIYGGVSYERLEREPIFWPCAHPGDPGVRTLYANDFPMGKTSFTRVEYLVPDEEPTTAYPFSLITRSHAYHFGSGARTRQSVRLLRACPAPYVEVSPGDADALPARDGDRIRITSKNGTSLLTVRVTPGVPPGTLFVPSPPAGELVNALFSVDVDILTRVPNRKICMVKIEKV